MGDYAKKYGLHTNLFRKSKSQVKSKSWLWLLGKISRRDFSRWCTILTHGQLIGVLEYLTRTGIKEVFFDTRQGYHFLIKKIISEILWKFKYTKSFIFVLITWSIFSSCNFFCFHFLRLDFCFMIWSNYVTVWPSQKV